MISDELRQIAYNEGYKEHHYISVIDNPYDGVNRVLYDMWDSGWWDAFDDY